MAKLGVIPPAVLPGTPKAFPIPREKLIALAKKVYKEDENGRTNPAVLAEDFKFEFPIVKLDKQKYLDAVTTFDLKTGIPNFESHAYDWRVDEFEPNRVWFTTRVTGTHAGTLKVFKSQFKPTGKTVLGAPECNSLIFNEDGLVTSFTGGYVIDNRLGNTNKLGALFGILAAIGVPIPIPQPGTWGWKVGSAVDSAGIAVGGFFKWVSGLFKGKQQ